MGQGGLQSNQQAYQRCFIGHSQGAPWRAIFEQVCKEVLPNFGLQPWYANKHFLGSVPLRQKVVDMIATTRYGIYDLSSWRENDQHAWIMPRNVLIELGMAIALNRPMLLLRHGENRECGLALPACLEGIEIGEFGNGKKILKETLHARLPSLTQHTPQQDWRNRYCHFGCMECSYREVHPQARQWGRQKIHIHISDGANSTAIDCSDFHDMIEEDVISRFNNLEFNYLDSLTSPQGHKFLLCSRCQEVRTSPFAIYRITPYTSADTFIAIGMSIALEKQFNYPITKILITEDANTIPSLLQGYEIIEERNYVSIKDRLNSILPGIIEQMKQTAWKPQPLPFEVFLPEKPETRREKEIIEQAEETVLEDPLTQEETPLQTPRGEDEESQESVIAMLLRSGETSDQLPDEAVLIKAYKEVEDGRVVDPQIIRRIAAKFEQIANNRTYNRTASFDASAAVLHLYEQAQRYEEQLKESASGTRSRAESNSKPINIFISHAREDEEYLRKIEMHLVLPVKEGLIEVWHKRNIRPGMRVTSEIDRMLNTANMILLLVSLDFIHSEECYAQMQYAMERQEAGKARVIPIILRSVDWEDTPFSNLQALPTKARPISTWRNQDEAFMDVAKGIMRVVEGLCHLW